MTYNKKYQTGYEKRALSYVPPVLKESSLELPERFYSKISHSEFKKIKEAFFLMSLPDYTLTHEGFSKTIRSLGIIIKSGTLYDIFDPKKGKRMTWEGFLEVYIGLRNSKGSFKEVDAAIKLLDKSYNGRWDQLFEDLTEIGDILSDSELKIFKEEILGNESINAENLKNILLGYK